MEIVIIDNAGAVIQDTVYKATKGVKTVLKKPGKNLYCSGGRKQGAKIAKGDYILFIDDDNVLEANCIKYLVEEFTKNKNLGVAGPLMLNLKQPKKIWCAGGKVGSKHLYPDADISQVKLPKLINGIDYFPNAFMVSKEIAQIVPFNIEEFPHNWSEADFCLRVKNLGKDVYTVTKAREWHDAPEHRLLTRVRKNTIYDQARSRILLRRRYFNNLATWLKFWFAVFPLSSLVYLSYIVRSSEEKKGDLLKLYAKGTIDGATMPLKGI